VDLVFCSYLLKCFVLIDLKAGKLTHQALLERGKIELMTPESAAQRLRLALDLFATGEALMRQRLRRVHPEWTEAHVESEIGTWLRDRPGARYGDAVGRPVELTNRKG